MRRVLVESPYAANRNSRLPAILQRWLNRRYARRCVRDALSRGEAPIASHLLYTQPGVLRDGHPSERTWGINAGLQWLEVADGSVVYTDRGISGGMAIGVARALKLGKTVEYRTLAPARKPSSAPKGKRGAKVAPLPE